MNKKAKVFLVVGILIVVGMLATISFGYWKIDFKQTEINEGSTACFQMTFTDDSDAISLLDAMPVTDQEGRKLTPYTFTITNVCKEPASYQVNLENVLHEGKALPLSYVKVELDQNTPNILTNHTEVEPYLEEASDAYKLTTGTLKGNESITYDLRLWVDESTPAGPNISEATFLSKVTIVAAPEVEENLRNEIEILVELDPFNEVEQKQSIRVDVTSKNHNLIAYVFSNNKLTEEELKSVSWNTIVPESKTHSTTNEYEDNGVYYVYYKDEKGNIEEKEIDINSFDREGPEIIEMSTSSEWGIENTITVKAQDVRSGIIGYAFVSGDSEPSDYITVDGGHEEKTFTHTVRENGTYTIWLKDSLGNISHKSIEVNKIDKINPSITFGINSQTEGNNGWYKDLSIKVQLSDNETGVSSSKYCVTTEESCEPNVDATISDNSYVVTLGNNGSAQKVCSIVIDNVGNSSGVVCSDAYKIDNTVPGSSFSINSQTVGSNGWYKALSIKISLSDTFSGVSSAKYCVTTDGSCTPNIDASINNNEYSVVLESNGSAQKVCSQVTDNAGNTSSVQCSSAYKVDNTVPSSSFSINSQTGGNNGWYKALSIKVSLSDTFSGVSSAKYCVTTGASCTPNMNATISDNSYVVTLGNNGSAQKVCSQVTDNAGNSSGVACSETYRVDGEKPSLTNVAGGVMTQGENGWWKELSLIAIGTDAISGLSGSKYCFTTGASCTPNINGTLNGDRITLNYGSNASAQRFCISFSDQAGNESSVWCDPTAYFVDVNNPTANIQGTSVNLNNITISAAGSTDNIGIPTYYYSLDNVTWYASSSNTYTFSNLGDGYYTVYVKVKDWSGRESAVVSRVGLGVSYSNVFVSSSGSDGNCGTREYPLATLQKGYANVKSGGNIILLSDINVNQQTNFDTANKVVTLTTDGGVRYYVRRYHTDSSILYVSNSNTVAVYGIYFDGLGNASTASLLSITGQGTHVNLTNNTYVAGGVNTSQWQGGGVGVSENAHLSINNAVIAHNQSANQGAGVYVSHATVSMSNGRVQDNTFLGNDGSGGGVFLYYSTFNMTGGDIYNNRAYNGAGISADHSTVDYSGGRIMDNKATYRGGAAQVIGNSKMTIDNADIFGNTGGAIAIRSSSTVIMNSGTIQNNVAADYNTDSRKMAAGVDSDNGSFAFNGGSIINNRCIDGTCAAGGVRMYKSMYLPNKGVMSGNYPKDFWQGD